MIDANVSLHLASRVRLARLRKTIAFSVFPRLRELVRVRNREQGDYFAFTVAQAIHNEDGLPELDLHLASFVNGRSVVSFIEDDELDEYIAGYKQEGWSLESLVPNRTFRDGGESAWLEFPDEDA